jgi:hypothetical protein
MTNDKVEQTFFHPPRMEGVEGIEPSNASSFPQHIIQCSLSEHSLEVKHYHRLIGSLTARCCRVITELNGLNKSGTMKYYLTWFNGGRALGCLILT